MKHIRLEIPASGMSAEDVRKAQELTEELRVLLNDREIHAGVGVMALSVLLGTYIAQAAPPQRDIIERSLQVMLTWLFAAIGQSLQAREDFKLEDGDLPSDDDVKDMAKHLMH